MRFFPAEALSKKMCSLSKKNVTQNVHSGSIEDELVIFSEMLAAQVGRTLKLEIEALQLFIPRSVAYNVWGVTPTLVF